MQLREIGEGQQGQGMDVHRPGQGVELLDGRVLDPALDLAQIGPPRNIGKMFLGYLGSV